MEPVRFVPLKTTSATQTLLTVTERAASQLKAAFSAETESFAGLRLAVDAGGCCGVGYSLAFAKSQATEDTVVESHGVKIFVAPADKELLQGATVDFVETPQGSGFHIDNPNAASGHGRGGGGCGCGSGGHGGHGHGGESGCGC